MTRVAAVGGTKLRYVEAGAGERTILLLHGLSDSLDGYLPVIAELGTGVHVVALDWPGHGGSSRFDGPYRIRDYGRSLLAFIAEVLGGRAVVVAGHSLGAMAAASAASEAPQYFEALVLEDPPFYCAQPPQLRQMYFYEEFTALRHLLLADAGFGFATALGGMPARGVPGRTVRDVFGPEFVERRAEVLRRVDPRAFESALDGSQFDGFDPDTALERLTCPVHTIIGNPELGAVLTHADAQRMQQRIADSSLVYVGGAGHTIHHERPREYAALLRHIVLGTGRG